MIITDLAMATKMDRALKFGQNLYTLDDIERNLNAGRMQAHTVGDTLAITQVNVWPRRKSVDVILIVGNMDESLQLENVIENWSKDIGADLITAIGRPGWWKFKTPGWKQVGTMYAKEI